MTDDNIMIQNDFMEEFLRLVGLGAIGGIARYLQLTYLQTKVFELGAFIATTAVGGVCGLALGWVVGAVSPSWQNVSAIVSGVVGLQIVYALTTVVFRITGKQFGIEVAGLSLKEEIDQLHNSSSPTPAPKTKPIRRQRKK